MISIKGIAINTESKTVHENTFEFNISHSVDSPIEVAEHPVYFAGIRTLVKGSNFHTKENTPVFITKRLLFVEEFALYIQGKINSPTYLKLRILRL